MDNYAKIQMNRILKSLLLCEAGDHLILSSAVYGGTFNLLTTTVKKMGIETTVVDPEISEALCEP